MQSAAFDASTPPIATTGTETARQIAARPSSPIGKSASGFDGVSHTGPAPMYAAPSCSAATASSTLAADSAAVFAPEVHAVRVQLQCRLDVVVHHEQRRQLAERPSALEELFGRRAFHTQLDDGRAILDRAARGLHVVDEDVQPHASSIRTRASSVAGSRFQRAS